MRFGIDEPIQSLNRSHTRWVASHQYPSWRVVHRNSHKASGCYPS